MDAIQLKTIRKSWQYSQAELASLLHTPVRTYQDWEGGKGRIPGIIEVTLMLVRDRQEKITEKLIGEAREYIHQRYPDGILSARERGFK